MRVFIALAFVACLALVLADSDDSLYREERNNYRGGSSHGGGRPYQPGYPGGRPSYPGGRPGYPVQPGYPGGRPVHPGGGSRYPPYHG